MYQEIRKLSYALIAILVLLGGSFVFPENKAEAAVGINKQINFQGKVTNTDGTNVADASYNFLFCIYTVASPASPCTAGANNDAVWKESKSLTTASGNFQTNLGDTTVFAALVNFNTDNIYLGVNFNSNGQMTPLVQFTSSPYALNSDLLDGGDWAAPGAIGTTTAAAGTFTNLSTTTGGVSIGAGQTYGGAGAVTLSSTTNGLTLDSGNNTLTIASSDTTLTASGLATLTVGANASLTNASGNLILQPAGSSTTASVQIGSGGAGSTTPDFFGLDVKSTTGDPVSGGYEGAMYYNTFDNKFRCFQGAAWTDCIGVGGGGGYATIQDEGVARTQRTTVNFIGAGVSCVDNSGNSTTDCTINGGAGGGISLAPSSADADSSANPSIFVNDTAGGNLIQLQQGGTDKFVVDNNGAVTTASSIGIGTTAPTDALLQVGSKTNRGDLNVYGDIVEKGVIDQQAITGVVTDTFVYDTTRDSDGGRWAESRTSQALSWYKETIDNTGAACNIASNDRCGGAEFPRKAIITATLDSVYIFDADNNTMWMKFSQGASNALGVDTYNDPSSVFALNGVIYIGTNNSAATGLYAIDFVNDKMYNYDATDRSTANVGISARNGGAATYATANTTTMKFYAAASTRVNDVHGAVLSGSSSFNTNTGSQNGGTFICAATDSSIAVINVNSGVTINYGTALADEYSACFVAKRARLYGINKTKQELDRWGAGTNVASAVNIDTATANQTTPTRIYDESATYPNLAKTAPIINKNPDTLEVVERASANSDPQNGTTLLTTPSLNTGDVIYVGTGSGLTEIHDVDVPAVTNVGTGWSKFYSKDAETGYMYGTPRGYFGLGETSYNANSTVANSTIRTGVLTGNGHAPTLGVNGVHGTAARFSGTTQWLCSDLTGDGVCEQDANYDTALLGFSASLWFRHDATIAAQQTILDRSLNATVAGFNLYMNAAGTLTANMRDGTNTDTATSAQSFNDGQWHHVFIERVATALTNPAQAVGFYMYVDGRLVGSDVTIAATLTLSGVTSTGIGASCTLANCSTAANLWVGDIDDVYIAANSASNADNLNQFQIRKLYQEGRTAISKKSLTATVADIASSTTVGKTASGWSVNDYAGRIVEITAGTGIGQTRRIAGNDATTLTVTPAWAVTPTGATFEIQSEQLYGSSNIVTGIGLTDNTFLGESRKMYVGTGGMQITTYANSSTSPGVKTTVTSSVAHGLSNGATVIISGSSSYNGSWVISNVAATTFDITRVFIANDANGWLSNDSGGVTLLEGMGNSSVSNVWHKDSGEIDDSATAWSGTGADDAISIGTNGTSVSFGTLAGIWTETDKINFEASLDKITNNLSSVRSEMVADGLNATSFEIGMNGGADLAEYYSSSEPLVAGDIVQINGTEATSVGKSTAPYQKTLVGVVATAPGIVLGSHEENSFPIALKGRVPVNVSTLRGAILKGDQITSSSLAGHGMAAIESGRVIGTALEDMNPETMQECSVDLGLPVGTKCGQIMTFVNLMDFSGVKMSDLMSKQGYSALSQNGDFANLFATASGQDASTVGNEQIFQSQWTNIFKATSTLGFLNKINDPASTLNFDSEILAKDVNATGQIVSPLIVTDTLIAKHIKAESIEGLEFIQTGIDSANTASAANSSDVKSLGAQLSELRGSVSSINEKLLAQGVTPSENLSIAQKVEFKATAIFKSMVEFVDRVIFRNNVEFEGQVVFNKDTAGYAVIKEGTDKVGITFEKEYATAPIVNASLSLQSIEDEELRKAAEQLLLVSNVKFIITNVTTKGLEIRISEKAMSDIPFSWQAVAINNAKTFESKIPLLVPEKTDLFGGSKEIIPTVEVPVADQQEAASTVESADIISNSDALIFPTPSVETATAVN